MKSTKKSHDTSLQLTVKSGYEYLCPGETIYHEYWETNQLGIGVLILLTNKGEHTYPITFGHVHGIK